MRLCYCSTILSSGYPAFIYLFFAPLGIISLRLLGVSKNILETESPCIWGGLFPLNTTLSKLIQRAKANLSMLLTELGIVTFVKLLQSEKVALAMLLTEFGMLILVKLLQKAKASFPILVTELGILILFNLRHCIKAFFPILVTELGILISVK